MSTYTDEERERAQKQFFLLQLLRLASLGLLLGGIAITQGAISAPYMVGIIMVVFGMGGFFFGPPLLARKFKARNDKLPDRMEEP
jgi:hypothetical protein